VLCKPILLAMADPKPNNASDTHTVEKILEKRYANGRVQYLLKWAGYPMEDSTWEPIENLTGDCLGMLDSFECRWYKEKILPMEQQ
ncbi:CG18186, partial [Drosophila busckii]